MTLDQTINVLVTVSLIGLMVYSPYGVLTIYDATWPCGTAGLLAVPKARIGERDSCAP